MKTLYKKDFTHLYVASAEQLKGLSVVGDHYARLLDPEEILRYSKDSTYDISTAAAESVGSKKHYCCATYSGNNLTAYTFFGTGQIEPAFNSAGYGYGGAGLSLPENALYMYKVFVLPEYRGKNQIRAAVHYGVSTLLPNGGWVVSSTDISNQAAQGMFRKLGFVQKCKINEYRLLGLGYYRMPQTVQLGGEGGDDVTTIELHAGRHTLPMWQINMGG